MQFNLQDIWYESLICFSPVLQNEDINKEYKTVIVQDSSEKQNFVAYLTQSDVANNYITYVDGFNLSQDMTLNIIGCQEVHMYNITFLLHTYISDTWFRNLFMWNPSKQVLLSCSIILDINLQILFDNTWLMHGRIMI